ncbi:uncharacterized protein LOC123426023 isoform X1 [Hordeum vulgare subsp. vulgare]|uniref:uncharacterized protein LOC123426023 isoform X1 n=1 Tax=Hordeum vulgare subsp. vulgare TaxID=112509 RepID=UPI001D1A40BE|nr:uncharacterized protein LOC123426023 isoform X1 [Hordeum vulgare subsp. vulgare]
MSSLFQRSLLERLHHVEKRIVQALELAGSVMGELGNSQGPRAGVVIDCCREFMLCREFCAQRTLLMYDSDFALVILPGWLTKAKTAKLPSATAVASDI